MTTTSNTYNFSPSLGEVDLAAFECIGVNGTPIISQGPTGAIAAGASVGGVH